MSQRLPYEKLAPEALRSLNAVYAYVAGSGLPKTLIDLCYLRASQINGCAYCIDAHVHDLLKSGLDPGTLALVSAWRDAPCFTEVQKAALAWTEAVTRVAETGVPDYEFEAARRFLSEKELTDLTMAVGLINAYNRIAISFRREPTWCSRSELQA